MSFPSALRALCPQGWSLVQMHEIAASKKYSFVGGPFGSNLTSADYVPLPGVPVIRGVNLDGKHSRFIDDEFVFVSEEKAESLIQNMAYPGDLVFTQRGTLGQVAEVPLQARFPRYVVSQSQMKLTPNRERADSRYLYHYYRSPLGVSLLSSRIQATGVPHINLSLLKEFPVLLPPLPEQKRIAAILDKADAIRKKRQEAIRLTEELLRSAFLEMFGDPVTNPKGWPVKELGELGVITTGSTPPSSEMGMFGGDIPFITPGDLESEVAPRRYLTARGADSVRTVRAGAALVCCIGATIGKMGIAPIKCAFNQQLNAIEWNNEVLDDFGYAALRLLKTAIVGAAKSTTMPILKKSSFAQIAISVPPVAQQEAYVRIARRTSLTLEHLESSLNLSNIASTSLTQRAFSGNL